MANRLALSLNAVRWVIWNMLPETRPGIDADADRWDASATSSLNELFRVCSDRVRRETLTVLRTKGNPISLNELADILSDDADQIRLSLVHIHLPMLDAVGLIRWNRTRESIELTTIPYQYQRLFDVIEQDMQ